ncbi:MAG: GNAT family N-acetyltransferase [Planctomycetota bacterium]|jgi:GNAT superfamily N-acetyltransferase
MNQDPSKVIAEKDGVILRHAEREDLASLDALVVICYTPIHESFVKILGQECYDGLRGDPQTDWEVQKTGRIRKAFENHPENVWVLEEAGAIFAFITFALLPEKNRAWIEENGVLPDRRAKGWGTYMLRHVLAFLRSRGIRFVSVEVDLDDVHGPARRAYQAAGFDRHPHIAIYPQDLDARKPGSISPERPDY